ncbi:hypothetical protein R1flu_022460 [Riccia fluitans]|uniref:Uncharacterized protein n=1 Tax=Riccia fluitans TaxID=41844 RepID=A0ABD1XTC2_9MARC
MEFPRVSVAIESLEYRVEGIPIGVEWRPAPGRREQGGEKAFLSDLFSPASGLARVGKFAIVDEITEDRKFAGGFARASLV